jgi:hypothetical protein
MVTSRETSRSLVDCISLWWKGVDTSLDTTRKSARATLRRSGYFETGPDDSGVVAPVLVTEATVAMTGFRLAPVLSWEMSTVSCSQRYFRCAFEQISIGTPGARVAFSGQRSPWVWALQAGFAGSSPEAKPETASSIGIAHRIPDAILFDPLWSSDRAESTCYRAARGMSGIEVLADLPTRKRHRAITGLEQGRWALMAGRKPGLQGRSPAPQRSLYRASGKL